MRYFIATALTTVLLLTAGCGFLDQNAKAIKEAIAALERDFASSPGEVVARHCTSNFTWEDANDRSHNATAWAANLQRLKAGGTLTFEVTEVRKLTDTSYLALIQTSASSGNWRLSQTWRRQDDSWKLANVNDLSQPGAPPPKSAAEQLGDDIGGVVDYGIGYTSLKQKRDMEDRIRKTQEEQDERTRRTLEE